MSSHDSDTRSAPAVQASDSGSAEPQVGVRLDFTTRLRAQQMPWLWSFGGALLVWLVIAGAFGFVGVVIATRLVRSSG